MLLICGKDPDNELNYFTKEGGLIRLQEIEHYLQELQRELVGGSRVLVTRTHDWRASC